MSNNYEIQGDIIIKGVSGTNGNIVTHDATGKLLDSGFTIAQISGGSGFTPLASTGITINPSGSNYTFAVTDYISATTTSSISGGLNTRLTTVENNYATKTTPTSGTYNNVLINSQGVVISGSNVSYALSESIPTSATFLSDYDNRYVNVAGDTMTGTLNVNAAISGTDGIYGNTLSVNSATINSATGLTLSGLAGNLNKVVTVDGVGKLQVSSVTDATVKALEDSYFIVDPTNKSYPLISNATFTRTISNLYGLKLATGSCTLQMFKNSGTSMSTTTTVTSASQTFAISGGSVSINDRVYLTISDVIGASDLEFTMGSTK